MSANRLISFTSDFGDRDGYVGIVKGVICGINGDARIVDISHQIKAFEISAAAWIIYNAFDTFPKDAVHIVVVDPAVGSSQMRLVLQVGETTFIGPDSGVFSLILSDPLHKLEGSRIAAYKLPEQSRYYRPIVSSTFHARDIFGPVAAHMSLGTAIGDIAEEVGTDTLKASTSLGLRMDAPGLIGGKVIYIDHFGNLITNIPSELLPEEGTCFVGAIPVGPVRATYRSVKKGELTALCGSHGFLEIAAYQGRADTRTGAEVGQDISVRPINDR